MIRKVFFIVILLFAVKAQVKAQTAIGDTTIYTDVDKQPVLINSMQFIGSEIKYPKNAREKKIQGKVVLSFVVEKDGQLTNFKVISSADPEFTAEFLRVMQKSPKWSPGIKNGQPVRTLHQEPLNFTLVNE